MMLFLWFLWILVALMAVEHLLHRYPMHRRGWPLMGGVFRRHAVLHHGRGRTDTNIDLPVWFGLASSLPFWGVLLALGAYGPAVVVAGTSAVYCLLWTGLHRAIHGVGGGWAKRLPIYRRWERHHIDHHAHPSKNFGTAFGPVSDAVFRTTYRASVVLLFVTLATGCEPPRSAWEPVRVDDSPRIEPNTYRDGGGAFLPPGSH